MKTKVEVLGYEIEIEEVDGVVTVKADFDGETVEEFTLEPQDGQSQEEGQDEGDDVKGFGDFEGQDEEDDFEGQGQDDEEEEEDGKTLESFQAFINKKK